MSPCHSPKLIADAGTCSWLLSVKPEQVDAQRWLGLPSTPLMLSRLLRSFHQETRVTYVTEILLAHQHIIFLFFFSWYKCVKDVPFHSVTFNVMSATWQINLPRKTNLLWVYTKQASAHWYAIFASDCRALQLFTSKSSGFYLFCSIKIDLVF